MENSEQVTRVVAQLRSSREQESRLRAEQRRALELAHTRLNTLAESAGNDPFDPSQPLIKVNLVKTDRGDALRVEVANCVMGLELNDEVGGQLGIGIEPEHVFERLLQNLHPLDIRVVGADVKVRFWHKGEFAKAVKIEDILGQFVAAVTWFIEARIAMQLRKDGL